MKNNICRNLDFSTKTPEELWEEFKDTDTVEGRDIVLNKILALTADPNDAWAIRKYAFAEDLRIHALVVVLDNVCDHQEVWDVYEIAQIEALEHVLDYATEVETQLCFEFLGSIEQNNTARWKVLETSECCPFVTEQLLQLILDNGSYVDILRVYLYAHKIPNIKEKAFRLLLSTNLDV